MKLKQIWLTSLLLCGFSACQWEEEPTLAEIFAGTYRGELKVLPSEGEEAEPVSGQVDMEVAGDRLLRLKFLNIPLAGATVDTLEIPGLLSLDGQNRITGTREWIGTAAGQQVRVELEGEMVYGRSELTVYLYGIDGGAVPDRRCVVTFQGTRR